MPTLYKRKCSKPRAQWSEESLRVALERIKAGEISIREAERYYGIPARTLRRRLQSNNTTKTRLGPDSLLGLENEKLLVSHIQRLTAMGFVLDRLAIRKIAFQFAELLKIDHPFNKEKEVAGWDWLYSFLRRNPQLTIKKGEGFTDARTLKRQKKEANSDFAVLKTELMKYELVNKPESLQSVDETAIQLIDKTDS